MSKLIADREKDLTFITALFRHHLAPPELVRERLAETSLSQFPLAAAFDQPRCITSKVLDRVRAREGGELAVAIITVREVLV